MPTVLIEYEVEPGYAGWTLAEYVGEKIRRLSAQKVAALLRSPALVHAEPSPLLPETPVWPGLRFALKKRAPGDEKEPAPLPIIFADDALLVVDKPAGLALHPTARFHLSTLTRALELHHPGPGGQKADPAHRLDRETSGLVACGRTPEHTRALKAAFAARLVDKSYLALVEGAPAEDAFEIDLPLKLGLDRIKVKMRVDPSGAASRTSCLVTARLRDAGGRSLALIRCTPRTGRQHQLRAHLAAVGLPLVGDKLYGPDDGIFLRLADSGQPPAAAGAWDPLLTEGDRAALRLPRHALHAAELVVPHPATGERLRLVAPLPPDLTALIEELRPA